MLNPDRSLLRLDDRAAFHAWLDRQPHGRFVRHDGMVVAMMPEGAAHARIKAQTWRTLHDVSRASGIPCEAFMSGPIVELDEGWDFVPDVVVQGGARLASDEVTVPSPMIVAEVTSPITGYVDACTKLDGYFRVPSVEHYLVLSITARLVVHHSRLEPGNLLTRIYRDGLIVLDTLGVGIDVASLYDGTELAPDRDRPG